MNEFLYNPPSQVTSVIIAGIELRKGDRVRILPRADAAPTELALSGRIALIESMEVDTEEKTRLGLVLEDDLGLDAPARRLSYASDEVEPLEGE